MKALIFNSGRGTRMGAFTRRHPKALAVIGDETIFARQLRQLGDAGITDVVVTTGPFADQLEATARQPQFDGLDVTFVPNPHYATTNYITSFWIARALLNDDVLLLHGDIVFTERYLRNMLADPRPDLVAVGGAADSGKDFKARIEGGVVREISVTLTGQNVHALQPMYKLSRRAIGVWLESVGRFVAQGLVDVYAEDALNDVADAAGINALPYAGELVAEVDDPADQASVTAALGALEPLRRG